MARYMGENGVDDAIVGGLFNDQIFGLNGDDLLAGLSGNDLLDGGNGNDTLIGGLGDDTLLGGDGNDTFLLNEGNDVAFGGSGNDTYFVNGLAGDHVVITDTSGNDTLNFHGGITGANIDMRPGSISYVDDRTIEVTGLGNNAARALELVLLQDLSGSFSDDLYTVGGLVDDLIAAVTGLTTSDVRLGLASFVDKPIAPFGDSGDYEYRTDLALTTNTDAWRDAVLAMSTLYGGDYPESQMTGLLQVALRSSEIGWSESSLKVVVLTTDATPHFAGDNPGTGNNGDTILDGPGNNGTGEDYPTIAQVRDALLKAGIIPVFAVTADVMADYQALVDSFGFGTVVPLEADSSDIIAAFEDGITNASETVIENVVGTMFDDTVVGNSANNKIWGKEGNDTIDGGGGNDRLFGNDGDDSLNGGNGKDILKGGNGNDTLIGANGNDSLFGENGRDTLKGGSGNDILNGGGGNDILNGGAGADTFQFRLGASGRDVIQDFENGSDVIEVQSNTALNFSSIGVRQAGSDTILSHDGSDFAVLRNITMDNIDSSDFVFSIA